MTQNIVHEAIMDPLDYLVSHTKNYTLYNKAQYVLIGHIEF